STAFKAKGIGTGCEDRLRVDSVQVAGDHPDVVAGCRNPGRLECLAQYVFWKRVAQRNISKTYVRSIVDISFAYTEVVQGSDGSPVLLLANSLVVHHQLPVCLGSCFINAIYYEIRPFSTGSR